ncbi:hypothetical protein [Thalassospira sp.]|uniref:hypothetical protein n=1 Tax=Thalassospira sp. TaxID=1912094 RepID=UPI003AA9E1B8
MHLLYCDESNLEKRPGEFLLYGGLRIDPKHAHDLSLALDELRLNAKVPRDYRFKFAPGPKGMPHDDFINLKAEMFAIAAKFEVKLIAYLILHDVAKNPDEARRNGINAVCYNFDCFLRQVSSSGLVLIDRFNDQGNLIDGHLRDKFSIGLKNMPYSPELRLTQILGFHTSAIGQSHFPSLVDVVLGSFRFAINAYTRNQESLLTTAGVLLKLIEPLLWRGSSGGAVPELSLVFSPKVIKAEKYRQQYEGLKGFLADNGIDTEQKITSERRY